MTTTITPIKRADRAPQFMAALERANAVRFARAQAKRDIASGKITLADALDLDCCQTADVRELLCALRRWGPTRAEKTLLMLPITREKAVRDLTERQRNTLLLLVGRNEDVRQMAREVAARRLAA